MPLKLQRRKNTGNWYLRGTVRGRQIYESTGTPVRKIAEEIRIRRETEALDVSIHGERLAFTFTDAALSYLEAGGDGTHLDPLLKRFKGKLLSEIGQEEIDKAAVQLKGDLSAATKNRQIYTPIMAVINHAAAKKPPWCAPVKIKRPQVGKKRIRWITHAEAERLIEAARPHMKPLVIFLLATGCRISEALYLDWRDVDLSRCHVTIYGPSSDDDDDTINTKNGEPRGIPLHPRAVAALANLPHRTGAVFRKPYKGPRKSADNRYEKWLGEPYKPRDGGGGMIKSAWATMCKAAGISNFTPHDCRHTWATWHYQKNRDLNQLMELGGWKTVDMVMRYSHVNTDHLRESIDNMWDQPKKNLTLSRNGTADAIYSLSYRTVIKL